MLRTILIIGGATIVTWLLIFQILIPYAFDRPLFGLFRSRDRLDLENDIAETREIEDLYALEEELSHREQKNLDRARGVNQARPF